MIKTYTNKLYKPSVFMDELLEAGLHSDNVRVDSASNGQSITVTFDASDESLVDAVEVAHDHSVLSVSEVLMSVKMGAKTHAENIPSYATWTGAQAETWIENNVNNLASAKIVLKALAKMVIALRNERWPDLQD